MANVRRPSTNARYSKTSRLLDDSIVVATLSDIDPIILAGGGFRHGQHLAFDRNNNTPLANLHVSMLQRLSIPVDRFASSTGTLNGLESVG